MHARSITVSIEPPKVSDAIRGQCSLRLHRWRPTMLARKGRDG